MINNAINMLLDGKNLTFTDSREAFDEILSGLANDVQVSSFLTALKSKGENEDEISAGILSSQEAVQLPFLNINYSDSIENISFNVNNNYIDINLANDIICASNNLFTSKYALSIEKESTFDVLTSMGVAINKENTSDIDFESLNFAYFYIPNQAPYTKYSENIRKILTFDNIFNITKKMLNPLKSKNLFLGVKNKEQLQTYANVALKIGKENSIIVTGENNFPFVSIQGETIVAEAWKNKIFTYSITPDLLGFNPATLDEIKCESNEHNANCILEIIQGKLKNSMYDVIVLNSALSLYISKQTESLMDGIELAKKTIDSGLAYEKFIQIKKNYS